MKRFVPDGRGGPVARRSIRFTAEESSIRASTGGVDFPTELLRRTPAPHCRSAMPDFTPAAAGMCAIRELDGGTLEGGADPRRESYAIGW